jgi:hypothetical protein
MIPAWPSKSNCNRARTILYRAHPTQLPLIPWCVACALSLGVAAFAWGTWDLPPVAMATGILGVVFLAVILIKRAVLRSHDYVLPTAG